MVVLKLYGHTTSTYEYIKMKLERNAREAGIDFILQEVNDLETFVKDGISSIPSVKINNQINLSLKGSDKVDHFIKNVSDIMIKDAYQIQKKRILVPTDFSSCAANAVQYAFSLAAKLDISVDVMHAYNPTGASAEGILYFDAELEGIRRKQLSEFISTNYEQWREVSGSTLTINDDFKIGFVVPVTKDIVDDVEHFFVVIGSTGGSASFKKFFGSVTTELASKVHCPVIIIPENVDFRTPKKIAYACDSGKLDTEAVQDLLDLLGRFEPELHLIHIKDDGDHYPNYDVESAIKANYPKSKIFYHQRENHDVVEGLNQFIEDEKMDCLAISKQKRGFINTLFHKSVTKEMSIKTSIPLVVIHK